MRPLQPTEPGHGEIKTTDAIPPLNISAHRGVGLDEDYRDEEKANRPTTVVAVVHE